MSQCVPSWDNNHFTDTYNDHQHPPAYAPSASTKLALTRNLDSNVVPNSAPEVPKLDYEVAELTWENGQLALHGLGQPRIPTWLHASSTSASGTLESIVNQATCFLTPSLNDKPIPCSGSRPGEELVPNWFNQQAPATMTNDALVPLCSKTNNNKTNRPITCEDSNAVPGGVGGFTHVESCSSGMNTSQVAKSLRRVPVVARDWSTMSSSEYSASSSRQQATLDTCTERDNGTVFTSTTSVWSADNTSSGMPCTKPTGDDHDSIFHSRSTMENDGGSTGATKKKGSSSVKRSRAAAIHNQSERKRRDRINQRMKTLQKLVPNSNKTDKASMLDEVIEYLKQLQAQVTLVNRMNMNMNMPQMTMMPMTLNQQAFQMSMMTPMGVAVMGMGGMLDMNATAAMAAGRANMPVTPLMYSSAFMPMQPVSWDPAQAMIMPDPMSTLFACQSHQPMTMESYRMMASLYQQMQQTQRQQLTPNTKN